MAEKAETILSRGIFNTRSRDYYDIYILGTTQKYDKALFQEALAATAEHRGSSGNITDKKSIVELIAGNCDLQAMWAKYQKKFAYAKDITYESIIEAMKKLVL